MNYYTGILFVIISGTCFGALSIFIKFAYASGLDSITALFLRFTIAAFFLLIVSIVKKVTFPKGKTLLGLILLGFVGYSAQSFSYFSALIYIPPGTVAALFYLYPAVVTILSVITLKQKIRKSEVVAIGLALIGTTLVVGFKSGEINILGACFGIGAAFLYGCYMITGSILTRDTDALASTTVIICSAAVFFSIVALIKGTSYPQTSKGYFAIFGIAIISTAVAILTLFEGLKRIGAVKSSMFSIFEPIVTLLLSMILLDEVLTDSKMYGVLFILSGAFLISIASKKKEGVKDDLDIGKARSYSKVESSQ